VRRASCSTLAILLLVAISPSQAQVAPPAHPGEGAIERDSATYGELPLKMSLTRKRTVLIDMARCTIERFRPGVMETVAHVPGSRVEQEDVLRLMRRRCLDLAGYDRLILNAREFRGAAYLNLYREKYPQSPPELIKDRLDFTNGIQPPHPPEFQLAIGLRHLADCLSRSNKAEAHAAVLALPGSKADDAAYKVLDKQAGICLNQKGKMKIDRAIMTGMIAEVLYREAVPVASGEGGH
jgi:hypothetical protein